MKELTPEEKWERATIANNFIFYKVMRNNPEICKELLEILLEMKIDRIEMTQEESIDIDLQSKGIRLDVYAKNSNQAFNVEMQACDTKELPERARYYQGVIDVDCLKSGQKYKELKDSYIVFICQEDIFNNGLGKYTFKNLCCENPSIYMQDRSYKYFFIAKNCDKILNKEQQAFLKLINSNQSSSDFSERILRLVSEAKKDFQIKRQFMDLEREKTYAYEKGLETGRKAGLKEGELLGQKHKALESAKNLLKMKVASPEQISQVLGLSLDKVLALKIE